MNFEQHDHSNLYLSIGSCLGSICSFLLAWFTTYNIAWLIGAVAGVVSICAGILTIKEKRMSIKRMKESDAIRQSENLRK